MSDSVGLNVVTAFFNACEDVVTRASIQATVHVLTEAEGQAKKNVKKEFIGRNDRTLSGLLLNSIYSGYEVGAAAIEAFLGVRKLPYARINEQGGKIVPVKAQHLWVPVYKNSGKMSPRDFINARKRKPSDYVLTSRMAGKRSASDVIPLFYLVDEVNIPSRPYLAPALEMAQRNYPERLEQYLKQGVNK